MPTRLVKNKKTENSERRRGRGVVGAPVHGRRKLIRTALREGNAAIFLEV